MLVTHYIKQATTAPAIIRQLLESPMRSREQYSVLSFVLYSMRPGALPTDSRWAAHAEIEIARSALTAASTSPTSQLREILRQLRWEVAIPDAAQIGAIIDRRQSQLSTIPEGTVSTYRPEARFLPGRTPYPLSLGGSDYSVTVRPITSRPNINTIGRAELRRALEYFGFSRAKAEQLATSIVAWRSRGDFVEGRGADETFYQTSTWSYSPKQAAFATWDEVAYVRGVDRGTLEFLRSRFTIFGPLSTVHVDYVEPGLISALSELPLGVVQRAIKHMVDPEPIQRSVGLGDIIGSRDAAAFESVAGRATEDDGPVIVVIDGQHGRMSAVFDLRQRRILDQWFEAPDVARPAS